MFPVLQAWYRSLAVLTPQNIGSYHSTFKSRIVRGVPLFTRTFCWLFFFDLVLSMRGTGLMQFGWAYFGITPAQETVERLRLMLTLGIWFTISTGYLLSLRKEDDHIQPDYFKVGFVRCLQLSLYCILILLLLLDFLFFFGIRLFPSMHWSVSYVFSVFNFIFIFFWLDSRGYAKSFFTSFERAINFFFYNLPVLCLLAALMVACDMVVSWGFTTISSMNVPQGMVESINCTTQASSRSSLLYLILAKYGRFMLQCVVVSALYTLYSLRKDELSVRTYFD